FRARRWRLGGAFEPLDGLRPLAAVAEDAAERRRRCKPHARRLGRRLQQRNALVDLTGIEQRDPAPVVVVGATLRGSASGFVAHLGEDAVEVAGGYPRGVRGPRR